MTVRASAIAILVPKIFRRPVITSPFSLKVVRVTAGKSGSRVHPEVSKRNRRLATATRLFYVSFRLRLAAGMRLTKSRLNDSAVRRCSRAALRQAKGVFAAANVNLRDIAAPARRKLLDRLSPASGRAGLNTSDLQVSARHSGGDPDVFGCFGIENKWLTATNVPLCMAQSKIFLSAREYLLSTRSSST